MTSYLASGVDTIGTHPQWTIAGLAFNKDTIISTLIAGAIVVLFGVLIARKATSGVPTGPQLIWETVVASIDDQVEAAIGKRVAPFVVPLATSLFVFILVANWLEVIPTTERYHLTSPTSDVNLTLPLALLVIVLMHVTGLRKRGLKYIGHFFKPAYLAPINIIEEFAKPVTLALRLFGNIFASGVMLALFGLMPFFILWLPEALWKLFSMGIGVIQAFIFALLTILYFSFALGGHGDEESHESSPEAAHEPISDEVLSADDRAAAHT
ncbi:MAG: ATP synthase F0 subunit A [Pseudonocardiales bacterium]|nr:MAG: ATP synthase F0 subunit A [Pseudonocardiales bacterium]PZS29719.1 MAG: ATP synthase F0 subunit A [Pseudonocardiales bacterium]